MFAFTLLGFEPPPFIGHTQVQAFPVTPSLHAPFQPVA
jgi:hypothetical protein